MQYNDSYLVLRSKERKYIKGLGDAFIIDLKANGLSPLREEFSKLKGQIAFISGKYWKILGIEAFATAAQYKHEVISLLVKPA